MLEVTDSTGVAVNSTATAVTVNAPSSAVPEFQALIVLPLLLSVLSVAVIVRHRKTANLSK